MPKQPTVHPCANTLANLLRMKGAHVTFHETVTDFPAHLRGVKPKGASHSPWQLLEHMRIAQEDILDFSRNPEYKEKKWPDELLAGGGRAAGRSGMGQERRAVST